MSGPERQRESPASGAGSDRTGAATAEPNGNAPTVQRTPQPMTPAGQAVVSAAATGSMGAFGSRP